MSTTGEASRPRRGATGRRGATRGSGPSRGGRRDNFGGSLSASSNASRNNRRPPRVAAVEPRPPAATAASITSTASEDNDEMPPEGELCFICAEPIKLQSVAPCDHRTCHICAIRLRALYKKDDCTYCKARIDKLIFTASATKHFADYQPSDIPYYDKKLSIHFETKEALEETLLLLRYNCPDPRCETASTGWKDFRFHARHDHDRLVCQLCIDNKKIFAHEHTLHTSQSLNAHMESDHAYCHFCKEYFYSDDEIYVHMRSAHEQCHICKESDNEARRFEYYRDYKMLEKHFADAHFVCPFKQCLEARFVVFASEVDFKAHQVSEHANELTAQQRRDAMRIEANFSYDDGESSRHGRSNASGGRKAKGRGNTSRDVDTVPENRDVLGVSTLASRSHVPGAGPANHASRRAMFGSGLTSGHTAPHGVSADRPVEASQTKSPEERHQAYMDKVSTALHSSEPRIAAFRSSVRTFRNGEASARDLISTIHTLIGEMDDCAPLVNGLIHLLEDADKKRDLLDAWNQYRIDTTQFPSLVPLAQGGASGSSVLSGAGYAGAGNRTGGQALRSIKRSTAASSPQVWDNVERAASASSGHGAGRPVALREHFPSLGNPSTASGSASIPGSLAHAVTANAAIRNSASSATPWSSSAVATPSASGRSTPHSQLVNATSAVPGRKAKPAAAAGSAFPSLPSNASRAAINAHKKSLFATRNSGKHSPHSAIDTPTSAGGGGDSGSATPWSIHQARIDEIASPTGGFPGALDGLNEALVASQTRRTGQQHTATPSASRKKQKGVQLMSMGGVHRG